MKFKMIRTAEEAAIAHYELERFMLETPYGSLGSAEGIIARTPPAEIEWSISWGKLILSWWDAEQSQSVRITGYTIESTRAILLVIQGLSAEPWQLVIDRQREGRGAALEVAPEDLRARRKWYAARLADVVRHSLPGVRIRHWSAGANLRHRVPGRFARLILTRRSETILAIGASQAEKDTPIDNLIAAGLIWFCSYNADRHPPARATGLWFFAAGERALTLSERLPLLRAGDGRERLACFEFDELRGEITEIRAVSQLELLTSPPRDLLWPEVTASLDPAVQEWHGRLAGLIPEMPTLIEPRYRPARRSICYEINGLEFARLPIDDWRSAEFGIPGEPGRTGRRERPLTERSLPELRQLVEEICRLRHAATPDQRHPIFRLRTEGWLESLLRRNIRAIDPELDPRHVYSQIPAWHADQRGVIDLLTIKNEYSSSPERGRLVVIEIKATEDLTLPLQGLDYWMRIEQARVRGEFGRHGLFAGVEIADRPPLLYLVAPRLRFHRSFQTIARCIAPEIDAWRIGLNSNWREGVRAHTLDLLRDL